MPKMIQQKLSHGLRDKRRICYVNLPTKNSQRIAFVYRHPRHIAILPGARTRAARVVGSSPIRRTSRSSGTTGRRSSAGCCMIQSAFILGRPISSRMEPLGPADDIDGWRRGAAGAVGAPGRWSPPGSTQINGPQRNLAAVCTACFGRERPAHLRRAGLATPRRRCSAGDAQQAPRCRDLSGRATAEHRTSVARRRR